MTNLFSRKPGAFERHLQRQHRNPLFANHEFQPRDIQTARTQDRLELARFREDLRETLQQCVSLDPLAESDTVLKLKEQLDLLYERSCGLGDDLDREQEAIRMMLTPMMNAVEKAAATDPVALQKLLEERQAREQHFSLLAYPIVCDLLRPDGLIKSTELPATLLSESPEALQVTLSLFDHNQLLEIDKACTELLRQRELNDDHPALKNLQIIEQHLRQPLH
ncbi:MAG: hypothetical protein KDJ38_17055 [Gammaproteobacteria bacterium]|nr:hypothetical protein [Gammaproteobacteria bacterium]